MRWIFCQAVNRCQAAIRAQHPGFLTLKVPLFPCNKKRHTPPPPPTTPPTHLGMYGEEKNVKEGEKEKGGRWKEEWRRKKRRMGIRGKAKARRN